MTTRSPLSERDAASWGASGSPLPWLVFLSGALGLVYEVLWMRHFVVVFGASTLATAATLSGFFLGLAAGSVAFGARAARWRRPLAVFGALGIGVAAGALLVPPVLQLYEEPTILVCMEAWRVSPGPSPSSSSPSR